MNLNSAIKFHGHLGPWLVIGLFMGSYGLKKVRAKKYFGLKIDAKIPRRKPISCLIDGLQVSSGCTLGKGNIRVIPNRNINISFTNSENNRRIILGINTSILNKLKQLKTHRDSEEFARRISHMKPRSVIKILGG